MEDEGSTAGAGGTGPLVRVASGLLVQIRGDWMLI